MRVIDLFAGAGGFTLGAHQYDADVESVGVEIDPDACATMRAAGFEVVEADVRNVRPSSLHRGVPAISRATVAGLRAPGRRLFGRHVHLHASAPCQTFSDAGGRDGVEHVDDLADAVRAIVDRWPVDELGGDDTVRDRYGDVAQAALVLEPARWIVDLWPDSISLEQVPPVLPIWEAYADALRGIGYSAWATLLHAEQYGVPQTRVRAWLGASRVRPTAPPTPTRARYAPDGQLELFAPPPVSMHDVLGDRFEQMAGAGRHGEGRPRHVTRPAPTITAKGTAYVGDDWGWRSPDRTADGRRIRLGEAAALQGFPAGYPFAGNVAAQFRQIGNAVNPQVARAVLEAVAGDQ